MYELWWEGARWSRRRAGLTSVISKMLSGSRLPPPTFLVQVTVPLCVTEMMRLATEQAFSCRVASTTCLWPTCRKTVYIYFTVCAWPQALDILYFKASASELTLHKVTIQGTFSTLSLMQSYGSSDSSISFPPSSSADIWTLGILSIRKPEDCLWAYSVYMNIDITAVRDPNKYQNDTLLTLCWRELPW